MSKVKKGSVLIRVIILLVLGAGTVYGYQKISESPSPQINKIVTAVTGQVQGIAAKFNIDTDSLLQTANQKLVDTQPIIKDQVETTATEVLGETTSNLTDTAKKYAEDTAAKISDQIKDIPRQEAIKITRSVCDELVKSLENQ